ncbi:MAG: bifunctional 4-hydroxy-3-methylbut-2-enyl diphosphate reductase/30S ribosomal protein S1 [Prevotella sp.]|nr:bifunctional 4-hydroxy-3-methylbut-2-enyl diphosphate reductase/30S ribosomal protein S1 [Prevotella sp.]
MKVEIRVAENAGFCFGVDRAVKIVYNILDEGGKAVTYGELIHNRDVTEELAARGVRIVNSPGELAALTDETVVIRSHGAEREIFRLLEEKGIKYRDGTCPFVRRIQKIAEEKSAAGYDIIIMGDENHPEVRGIASYCHNAPKILKNDTLLYSYLKKFYKNSEKKVAIAAQTTYNISIWDKCTRTAAEFPNAETVNTICSATADRQEAAARLARTADLMVVVGGKHSSNTVKLAEICGLYCKACVHAENAGELDFRRIGGLIKNNAGEKFIVGVTAGASAPAYIIKEVTNQMSEKLQNMEEDFNFEEALDASFKKIYTGQRVKGYITAVNDAEAIVDVGTKHTGYVSLDELTNDTSLKPADVVKPGDEVELIVIKVNDAEGIVTLSKKKVDAMIGFDKIVKAKENDEVLEGTVSSVVKGGVIIFYEGTRVFIPASQATARRDEKLENLVKKTVRFKIIEVNEQRGKAVGSIRVVLAAEKDAAKTKFWDTVQVGDVFKGEVKSLTNYGAFVDLGGIDGMVHISELSWNRIKHPSEVVQAGDVIEVYVKDLDREADRISLGYKKNEDNPWVKFDADYNVGDVVKAKVVSITPFGAFAQIVPGIDGLIHISQLAENRVTNVKDVLSVGDEVEAKITEIDVEKKRISISIRALIEERGGAAETDEAAE